MYLWSLLQKQRRRLGKDRELVLLLLMLLTNTIVVLLLMQGGGCIINLIGRIIGLMRWIVIMIWMGNRGLSMLQLSLRVGRGEGRKEK